jgi:hypothetical protein
MDKKGNSYLVLGIAGTVIAVLFGYEAATEPPTLPMHVPHILFAAVNAFLAVGMYRRWMSTKADGPR